MIIATVTIRNMTGTNDFTVKINNVFETGDGRQIATVEALPVDGKIIRPFCEQTAGGPCQTSTTQVPVAFLKDIGIAVELPVAQAAEVGTL